MNDVTFQIHWISFTVHATAKAAFELYDYVFSDQFGDLNPKGHGGKRYKEIYEGIFAFKIYIYPADSVKSHFHFEIPGQACELIAIKELNKLHQYLESVHPEKFKYTRFDFAFDHVKFSPEQVLDAIKDDKFRSLAKKKSITMYSTPFDLKDNGELGRYTLNFGSRQSERMFRIYDSRGFNRLELEFKDNRSHHIACEIFTQINEPDLGKLIKPHLLDYVDFFTDWWNEFINGDTRANVTLSKPKEAALDKTVEWLDKQVMPSLSVVEDAISEEFVKNMINKGRIRRNPKLDSIARLNQNKRSK